MNKNYKKIMKCVKNLKTGNVIRVDDKQAQQIVGSQWKYVPKTEWKVSVSAPKEIDQVTAQVSDQVDRKPYKKGSKPEKKSK